MNEEEEEPEILMHPDDKLEESKSIKAKDRPAKSKTLYGDKEYDKSDRTGSALESTEQIKHQMEQNLNALRERGDKIEELNDKRYALFVFA